MQKRIIQWVAAGLAAVIAIGSLAGAFLSCSAAEQPEVSAVSSVLMEAVTGEVLYEKNAREPRPMASTTKIMSALLCLESGDLDTEFTVDSQAIQVEGSSMGLVEGDTVTKRALCYGMLLPSGNDAAGAAAVRVAGSIPAFVAQMNERATALGLTQTHFVTPSGLHDDDHYSTACDMAVLAASALQNENFREICAQSSAQVCFGNPPYQRWLKNSNKLLTMDESVIGVKTGFTDEAGRCLVSAAERNGVTLICVTLADPNDWQDHLSLYDWGFSQVTPAEVSPAGGLAHAGRRRYSTGSGAAIGGEAHRGHGRRQHAAAGIPAGNSAVPLCAGVCRAECGNMACHAERAGSRPREALRSGNRGVPAARGKTDGAPCISRADLETNTIIFSEIGV